MQLFIACAVAGRSKCCLLTQLNGAIRWRLLCNAAACCYNTAPGLLRWCCPSVALQRSSCNNVPSSVLLTASTAYHICRYSGRPCSLALNAITARLALGLALLLFHRPAQSPVRISSGRRAAPARATRGWSRRLACLEHPPKCNGEDAPSQARSLYTIDYSNWCAGSEPRLLCMAEKFVRNVAAMLHHFPRSLAWDIP